jgi:hypothetical protein
MSLLTAQHIADAIAILEAVGNMPYNPSPEQLGRLQGKAACAAIALKVYSGLDQIKIDIKE